ncbi:hypothetical protein [Moraxella ovis]|uniref:hypothetical protein n=1 Tax=Moraxella ovis TaxID=29433 RepID=UPI000D98713D|nr:hypothetical protein [Moraxella ovis]SPX84537.1 Uncharacterised protein [Moraxella ovis]STZ07103.1 Uncharacterised protein [Moraxella ovis]
MKLFFKSLTLAVITSTCISNTAFADISFTKDDLIGKWECYDHDPGLQFRAESVIENRADGTHSENSVMYFDDMRRLNIIKSTRQNSSLSGRSMMMS